MGLYHRETEDTGKHAERCEVHREWQRDREYLGQITRFQNCRGFVV